MKQVEINFKSTTNQTYTSDEGRNVPSAQGRNVPRNFPSAQRKVKGVVRGGWGTGWRALLTRRDELTRCAQMKPVPDKILLIESVLSV